MRWEVDRLGGVGARRVDRAHRPEPTDEWQLASLNVAREPADRASVEVQLDGQIERTVHAPMLPPYRHVTTSGPLNSTPNARRRGRGAA